MSAVAAKKAPARKAPAAKRCPDCDNGQTSQTFQLGSRRKSTSPDKQEALCLTCWGTGQAPTP